MGVQLASKPHGAEERYVAGLAQFDQIALDEEETFVAHGTAVCVGEKGALFVGRSGSGKSATALALIALGARLVADDRVVLKKSRNWLEMSPLAEFAGLIEARGMGILRCGHESHANLSLIIDMDRAELHRLPPYRTHEMLTLHVHLVYGRDNWSLVPSVLTLLQNELYRPEPY